MLTIWLVPPGAINVATQTTYLGKNDHGLSSVGQAAAGRLADCLKRIEVRPGRIHHAPTAAAWQTAIILAHVLTSPEVKPVLEEALAKRGAGESAGSLFNRVFALVERFKELEGDFVFVTGSDVAQVLSSIWFGPHTRFPKPLTVEGEALLVFSG